MRTTLLLTILLNYSLTLTAQFTVIQTSTNNNLNDVHFINTQIGFAVGENGTMVKTIDGGNIWTTLSLNTTENLTKVQFIDNNVGFALSDSVFFKTNDGGMNFTSQVFSETLKDFHFISATEGKIVGYEDGGIVLSTIDGGDSFSEVIVAPSWYFWDSLQGIGTGNYYTFNSIDYTNGKWEIGGSDYDYNAGEYPYALYSTNGMQWTTRYLDWSLIYGDSRAVVMDVKTNSNGEVFHLKTPDSDRTYLYLNGFGELSQPAGQPASKMGEFGLLNDTTFLIPISGNLRIYTMGQGIIEHTIDSISLTGGVGIANNTIGFLTGENGKLVKYTDLSTFTKEVDQLDFSLFPSPANDYLMIETKKKKILSIEIMDINGKIVWQNMHILNNQIDISMLSSGFYFIKIKNGSQNGVRKFIKN